MALHNGGANDLLREDRGKVAILTMNRPQARNALSESLLSALQAELDQIKDDAAIHVVVLRGEGPGFCAGHDLREVSATRSRAYYEWLLAKCTQVMETIKALPQPVIAAVHGIATAAGAQLAATCDMVVAADDARFATPGVNIGLWCSTPMVAVSRSVNQKAAMEMLLTGDLYDAETAQRFGLVNRVVPAASLLDEAMALADKIAAKSRLVISLGKEAFYRQGEMDRSDAYRYAADVMTHNLLKEDAAEGIEAFIEKREPKWRNR